MPLRSLTRPSGGGGGGGGLLKMLIPKSMQAGRSFAQFRLPEGKRSICAFGHEANTIIGAYAARRACPRACARRSLTASSALPRPVRAVVTLDGSFFKAAFDPKEGGDAVRTVFSQFASAGGFELAGVA